MNLAVNRCYEFITVFDRVLFLDFFNSLMKFTATCERNGLFNLIS